jgi:hypothetical protein
MEIIVGKKNWEDFKNGDTRVLKRYTKGKLHYAFGDLSEKYTVVLTIYEGQKERRGSKYGNKDRRKNHSL